MSGRRRSSLPSVIFIGPLKTGTTWIHDYLSESDRIMLPKGTKETFFFDRYHDRGVSFYESFFEAGQARSGMVTVEVAPSYGGYREVLERIAAELTDVTVVISVRDPVERTISQYRHEVRYGYYREPLDEHLGADDPIIRRSCYPEMVDDAVEIIGADRVKVLDFAELRSDPRLFCARVCACVGVPYRDPSAKLVATASNEARVPRFRMMSRVLTWGTDLLKRHRLNVVSQTAKRMGLRRFIERPARADEHVATPDQTARLLEVLDFDYDAFLGSVAKYVPAPAAGFEPLNPAEKGAT